MLLAALRLAPRRYRMPPLPAGIEAARSSGAETALAFAIEAARLAKQHDAPPGPEPRALFTEALAALIRAAMRAGGGDPAFQALVLRAQEPEVEEHVRLAARAAADLRTVRSAIDAVAHPGKLRHRAPGAMREALSLLHRLAAAGSWTELKRAIEQLPAPDPQQEGSPGAALSALHASPGLERLERGQALRRLEAVQRYQALCGQHGPAAGSQAALARGGAAARRGADAEEIALQAFRAGVDRLNRRQPQPGPYRVVRSLLTPRGFPGATDRAKDEWDVAIVRDTEAGGPAHLVLLAEVKASPAAATSDFPRLVRGLHRLAQAQPDAVYAFASPDGAVPLCGASLRGLQPPASGLPPQVVYCCTAPGESRPQRLAPASRALLLAEPASIAFARDGSQDPGELVPVWEAVLGSERMRSTLHQYETARSVREAMLHPDDLRAALALPAGPGGMDA